MPIYEYRCNDCGHQFEVSQRMSDDPLTECEVCGGQVSKMLFAPAIHFKGTGFHNTDYGSKRRGAGDDSAGSGPGVRRGLLERGLGGDGKAAEKPAAASSGSLGRQDRGAGQGLMPLPRGIRRTARAAVLPPARRASSSPASPRRS